MDRIEREKRTLEQMVRIYCRRAEGNKELCDGCKELLEYAAMRLDRCPFGQNKGVCNHCHNHCYAPVMRDRIRAVMRFSGPRMLLYAPLVALRHLLQR